MKQCAVYDNAFIPTWLNVSRATVADESFYRYFIGTCELVGWVEQGKVPGPAGDVVLRKAVTCDQISLPFRPL